MPLLNEISIYEQSVGEATKGEFRWPWEVWEAKHGSKTDVVVLACTMLSMAGFDCGVVQNAEGDMVVAASSKGNRFVIDPSAAKVHEFNDAIDTWDSPENTIIACVMPHTCAHRNRSLFAVLTMDMGEPRYPSNPAVQLARLKQAFPEFSTCRVLQKPFERLEAELSH